MRVSLFFCAGIALLGCATSNDTDGGSAGGKADGTSDADPWFDITVLHANVRQDLTLRSFDYVESCDKTDDHWANENNQSVHYETFDCTKYIEGKVNGTAFKALPKWTFRNGTLDYALDLDTPLAVIETASPVDRLEKATHIAFSESFLGGRVNLFVANGTNGQTREVGKVKLQDGRTAVVHRWIAAFAANGHTTAGILRTLPWKPALVRDQNGNKTYYWDKLIGDGMFKDYILTNNHYDESKHDYVITAPNSYDRSSELL